jgi:hypothetical protein
VQIDGLLDEQDDLTVAAAAALLGDLLNRFAQDSGESDAEYLKIIFNHFASKKIIVA